MRETKRSPPTQQQRAGFGLICFNEGEQAVKNFVSSLSFLMVFSVFFWFAAFFASEKPHTWASAVISFVIMGGLLFGLVICWVSATRGFYPAFHRVLSDKSVRNFMHYIEALFITSMLMTTMAFLYVIPPANAQQLISTLRTIFAEQPQVEQPAMSNTIPRKPTP